MEVIFVLLILGGLYEMVKPTPKKEKSPMEKVKDAIRAKEDGKITADQFFTQVQKDVIPRE